MDNLALTQTLNGIRATKSILSNILLYRGTECPEREICSKAVGGEAIAKTTNYRKFWLDFVVKPGGLRVGCANIQKNCTSNEIEYNCGLDVYSAITDVWSRYG